MQNKFPITLVVACAENGVIGTQNTLPWRLKSDLQRFKALTTGKPIIMGRKTFESLGHPLPNRLNIVLSRTPFAHEGVVYAATPSQAIEQAQNYLDQNQQSEPAIMVIGGGEIYKLFWPLADAIEITRVNATPEGDTYFPEIDVIEWQLTAREKFSASLDNDHPFAFERYERIITQS